MVLINTRQEQYDLVNFLRNHNIDIDQRNSFMDYFSSRDFSLNQVLLRPDTIIFTVEAENSFKQNIILHDLETEELNGRIALRSLLFSLRENLKLNPQILNSLYEADDYDILLHLFKAYNVNVEDRFFDVLKSYRNDIYINNVDDYLLYLVDQVPWFHLTENQYKIVENIKKEKKINKFEEKYSDLE